MISIQMGASRAADLHPPQDDGNVKLGSHYRITVYPGFIAAPAKVM